LAAIISSSSLVELAESSVPAKSIDIMIIDVLQEQNRKLGN
jgi:hypothetical protein